jgi:hypothetical protein
MAGQRILACRSWRNPLARGQWPKAPSTYEMEGALLGRASDRPVARLPGPAALPPVPDPPPRTGFPARPRPGSPPGGARFQTVTIFLRRHLHGQQKYSPAYFFHFFTHIGIHRIRTVARIQLRLSTVICTPNPQVAPGSPGRCEQSASEQGTQQDWPRLGRSFAVFFPGGRPAAPQRAGATSDVPSRPNRGLVRAAARDQAVRHRVRR